MRVKRELVKREIVYNINTHEIEVRDLYKDVLDESLHRKLIKDITFWSYLIAISFNVVSLIISKSKFSVGLSTTIILLFSYFLYKRIQELKK